MPKISVLMPVYKPKEAYLRMAIESILNQTYPDFEFLILDDCPDDNREAIVRSYSDARIVYLKNEKNLGITPSRNKLIELAQGDYLAVMDHDDLSLPTRFEKQAAFLDHHPDYGVVGSKVERVPGGKITENPTDDATIKLALFRVCCVTNPASMIRKSVLIEHHIRYEEAFSPAEDYALWCRLIPYTKFYNIPHVLFQYRYHESNTSKTENGKMKDATFAIHSFVQATNPALYHEFLLKAKHTTRIRLFGFIPLIKIISTGYSTKGYLFEAIPLWASKKVIKLKEK